MNTGTFSVRLGDEAYRVAVTAGGEARVDGVDAVIGLEAESPSVYIADDGLRRRRVFVIAVGHRRQVFVDGEVYEVEVGSETDGRPRGGRASHEVLDAPMPAKVTAIVVEPGQAVRRGDVLIKLEAMKMELAVRAPRDGTVTSIACRVGELVQPGVGLLEIA